MPDLDKHDRTVVRLVGLADQGADGDRCQHRDGMNGKSWGTARRAHQRRAIERAAVAEASRLLDLARASPVIWSHHFRVDDQDFLLSTYVQPAREVRTARQGAKLGTKAEKVLPPRLVIEVSPAPRGLTHRTILREPRLPADSRTALRHRQRDEGEASSGRRPERRAR